MKHTITPAPVRNCQFLGCAMQATYSAAYWDAPERKSYYCGVHASGVPSAGGIDAVVVRLEDASLAPAGGDIMEHRQAVEAALRALYDIGCERGVEIAGDNVKLGRETAIARRGLEAMNAALELVGLPAYSGKEMKA